jgi:hypothetical protein
MAGDTTIQALDSDSDPDSDSEGAVRHEDGNGLKGICSLKKRFLMLPV